MSIQAIQILMPVYNAEKYIDEAIASLQAQTHAFWELLAIDDGSTDQSLDKLKEWQVKDNRICIRTRQNKGLVATLNELTEWSTSPIVARMDADDISHPERLEKQLAALERLDRPGVVACWVSLFGAKQADWHYRETDPDIRMLMLFGRCPLIHASLLADRRVFEKHSFNPSFTHLEDLDFLLRLTQDSTFSLYNVQQVLYSYRQHPDSIIYQNVSYRINEYKKRFAVFLRQHANQLTEEQIQAYMAFVYDEPMQSASDKTILQEAFKVMLQRYSEQYPNFETELMRRWERYEK
mgnify:CR=1 FL=1